MKFISRHPKIVAIVFVVVAIICIVMWREHGKSQFIISRSQSINKQQHSTSDPNSIWIIVNKKRPLPESFVPYDLVTPNVPLRLTKDDDEMKLRQEAAGALENLVAGAKNEHYDLLLASGYRSWVSQKALHDFYVSAKGAAAADADSARPGFSEHQTGLAADVGRTDHQCEVQACFASTPEGKWLAANAYKYGFIVRYKPGNKSLTGYVDEPWHIRYVGKDLANQIQQSGQTLEQFFGLPPAPDYQN